MESLTIVVAATESNGIGLNGKTQWHIHEDLEYFRHVTQHAPPDRVNAVIMGRGTWDIIPKRNRPLPGRLNIVLSRNPDFRAGEAIWRPNLESAIASLPPNVYRVFIIGGSSLYEEVLGPSRIQADRILMTRILKPDFPSDKFFPEFRDGDYGKWKRNTYNEFVAWTGLSEKEIPKGEQEEHGITFEFQMWTKE